MIPTAEWKYDCQAELDRKSIEALEWIECRHGEGSIDEAQYIVAIQMFQMITRGLIDQEVSQAADEVIFGYEE